MVNDVNIKQLMLVNDSMMNIFRTGIPSDQMTNTTCELENHQKKVIELNGPWLDFGV